MPYDFRAEDWLTTTQAAALPGVKAGTMRARRSKDRETLPYIRVGSSILYPRSAVESLAKELDK